MEDMKPRLIILGAAILLALAWGVAASSLNTRLTNKGAPHPSRSEQTLPG